MKKKIVAIALAMTICLTAMRTLRYEPVLADRIEEVTGEDAAKQFTEYVRQRIAKAALPTRLKDLNLTIEQLSLPVEDIRAVNLINNLPRSMTTDDLFDFVKLAY